MTIRVELRELTGKEKKEQLRYYFYSEFPKRYRYKIFYEAKLGGEVFFVSRNGEVLRQRGGFYKGGFLQLIYDYHYGEPKQ